jgi:valyl-tRNA synthetase
MSKSLGNSPDPLELIKKYGADGVRVGMLLCSPAGNDLMFDESLTEQGRNFSNKIWNAFRLVNSWEIDENISQPEHSQKAIQWFQEKLNETLITIEDHYSKFRLSDALMAVYKLFWDEFSSWYLEIIKPAYQQAIDIKTLKSTQNFFEQLLEILHPFMPFITEELWQNIAKREKGESIMLANMPSATDFDKNLLTQFEDTKKIIAEIRTIRKGKNIPMRDTLELLIKNKEHFSFFDTVISRLGNLSAISFTKENIDNTASFMVNTTEYLIPLGDLINPEEELKKLEEELKYLNGFLNSVMKKMSNEKFVKNAPAKVVEMEKKKMADAENKITIIENQITKLKK